MWQSNRFNLFYCVFFEFRTYLVRTCASCLWEILYAVIASSTDRVRNITILKSGTKSLIKSILTARVVTYTFSCWGLLQMYKPCWDYSILLSVVAWLRLWFEYLVCSWLSFFTPPFSVCPLDMETLAVSWLPLNTVGGLFKTPLH